MFGVGLQKSGTNPKEERRRKEASRRGMESQGIVLWFPEIWLKNPPTHLSVLQRVTWILAAITRPRELHPGGLCLKAGFPTSKIEKKCSKTQKCPQISGVQMVSFEILTPSHQSSPVSAVPGASVPKKKHMPRTLGSGLCCHQTWQSEIPELNRDYSRYYSHLWENHGGFFHGHLWWEGIVDDKELDEIGRWSNKNVPPFEGTLT